jgi:hypothetical protein
VIQAPKKAASITFMANSRPHWIHPNQQRIGVAIHPNIAHLQHVSAGLALFPKLVSGTRKEDHFAAPPRHFERLRVHKSQHQHFARRLILDNCRRQPARFFEIYIHALSLKVRPKTKIPLGLLRQRAESVLVSDFLCYPHLSARSLWP